MILKYLTKLQSLKIISLSHNIHLKIVPQL